MEREVESRASSATSTNGSLCSSTTRRSGKFVQAELAHSQEGSSPSCPSEGLLSGDGEELGTAEQVMHLPDGHFVLRSYGIMYRRITSQQRDPREGQVSRLMPLSPGERAGRPFPPGLVLLCQRELLDYPNDKVSKSNRNHLGIAENTE